MIKWIKNWFKKPTLTFVLDIKKMRGINESDEPLGPRQIACISAESLEGATNIDPKGSMLYVSFKDQVLATAFKLKFSPYIVDWSEE